nr:MAG TPA: hypothetical protein [Caudoviricetes sp.]
MTTPAPEIAATWTDAGVTLRIRHLDALGPDGLTLMAAELHRLAAAQPRTCAETPAVAARTA